MAAETRPRLADEQEEPRKASVVPRWAVITALAVFAGVVIVIIYGYLAKPAWIGVANKKFWDYLELLIVPAALAIGVYFLNLAQERKRQAQEAHREREREAEAEQREREREATEEARREREREAQAAQRERELEVENQRAQDEALQAYLDQIGKLMLDKDSPLRQSKEHDEVRTLARARTLTVLERVRDLEVVPGQVAQAHVSPKDNVIRGQVGSFRKRAVVQFLYEGDLIQKDRSVISLRGADLSGAYLSRTSLRGVDLYQAILVGADLSAAQLNAAYLRVANLLGADLRHAVLEGADLRGTALVGAYLLGANLSNADLRSANLTNADLRWATLDEANLSGADLSGADLREQELYRTDLSGASGISNEELEQQAESLEGVTMPNGQKYKDWLKDKRGGKENE